MTAFNVHTLKQARQQVAVVLTLDSLDIDVCCVSETHIQDASIDMSDTTTVFQSSNARTQTEESIY